MSLIEYGTTNPPGLTGEIPNIAFWSLISIADFAAAEKLDNGITAARCMHALTGARDDLNRQLSTWQDTQIAAGYSTAAGVPVPSYAVEGHFLRLYKRAVYALAHASLMERYRNYSATPAGDERGEGKDITADDLRRDARWAVSEILGQSHTTVELI